MNNSDIDLSKLPKFVYIFLIALVAGILFWAFIGSSLLTEAGHAFTCLTRGHRFLRGQSRCRHT